MTDRPITRREDRFLNLAEVKDRVGLGHTMIYRKIAAKEFPAGRELGPRCVRWLESEITTWIHNRPVRVTAPGPRGA